MGKDRRLRTTEGNTQSFAFTSGSCRQLDHGGYNSTGADKQVHKLTYYGYNLKTIPIPTYGKEEALCAQAEFYGNAVQLIIKHVA